MVKHFEKTNVIVDCTMQWGKSENQSDSTSFQVLACYTRIEGLGNQSDEKIISPKIKQENSLLKLWNDKTHLNLYNMKSWQNFSYF